MKKTTNRLEVKDFLYRILKGVVDNDMDLMQFSLSLIRIDYWLLLEDMKYSMMDISSMTREGIRSNQQ